MNILETRRYQMFPVLNAAQVEAARRFSSGPERRFGPGECVYAIGERGAPSWLMLGGTMEITRRDGLRNEAVVTTYGIGQFSGEVNQLAGRPSITTGRAGPDGCSCRSMRCICEP